MAETLTYDEKTAIGDASEEAFFAFADRINSGEIETPDWLHWIERSTYLEDLDGIDAIAYTDRGRIAIQIKSSVHFIVSFRRKHRHFQGFIIIVHPKTDERVFGREFIRKLEEHYVKKRHHDL